MAHTCDGQGDRQTAKQYYQRAVEIFREIGDQWAIRHPLCDLAWIIWDQGNTLEARSLMEEHLAAFQQLGVNTGGLGMALQYMITITMSLGDLNTAEQYIQEKNHNDLVVNKGAASANYLADAAWLDFVSGRLAEAHQKLEHALETVQEKNTFFRMWLLKSLGNVLAREKRAGEALACLEECLPLARPPYILDWFVLPEIQADYARALFLNGRLAEAQAMYRQSLGILRDSRPKTPTLLEGLAEVQFGEGNPAAAAVLLGAAQRMRESMHMPLLPVYERENQALVAALQEALGTAEYQSALHTGSSMAYEESIEYAMAVSN